VPRKHAKKFYVKKSTWLMSISFETKGFTIQKIWLKWSIHRRFGFFSCDVYITNHFLKFFKHPKKFLVSLVIEIHVLGKVVNNIEKS